jgi:hypothetical protein
MLDVSPVYKTENMAVGILLADHTTPYISKKLALTSPTSCGHPVGIVRSQTQDTEFMLDVSEEHTFRDK